MSADSHLQTFPPSEAQGKISSGARPPRDADGTNMQFLILSVKYAVAFVLRHSCIVLDFCSHVDAIQYPKG